jgi:hypothetical protein
MFFISLIAKCSPVIAEIFLYYDPVSGYGLFEFLLGLQSLVGVQVRLEHNVYVVGGVVHEDAPSGKLLRLGLLSIGGDEPSFGVAHKVID